VCSSDLDCCRVAPISNETAPLGDEPNTPPENPVRRSSIDPFSNTTDPGSLATRRCGSPSSSILPAICAVASAPNIMLMGAPSPSLKTDPASTITSVSPGNPIALITASDEAEREMCVLFDNIILPNSPELTSVIVIFAPELNCNTSVGSEENLAGDQFEVSVQSPSPPTHV